MLQTLTEPQSGPDWRLTAGAVPPPAVRAGCCAAAAAPEAQRWSPAAAPPWQTRPGQRQQHEKQRLSTVLVAVHLAEVSAALSAQTCHAMAAGLC